MAACWVNNTVLPGRQFRRGDAPICYETERSISAVVLILCLSRALAGTPGQRAIERPLIKNSGQAPKDMNGTDPNQNVSRSDPEYRHEPSRGVRAGPYRPALDGSPGREVGDRCQHHRVPPSTTIKGIVANHNFCSACHPFQGDIGCG